MPSAQTIGVSAAMGIILFGLTVLFAWFSQTYGWSANLLKWIGLPMVGFGIALGMNSILQYTTCQTVNILQLLKASSSVLVAVFIALIVTMAGVIRSPIEAAVPLAYKLKYAGMFAVAFYMFWAGMFGEALASGFAQVCV
jgi:hypothetical protein